MEKFSELYSKNGIYNKGIACEVGLIPAVIFQTIMSSIYQNEQKENCKNKFFLSSENAQKIFFPEITQTKVFNALNMLRIKGYIELEKIKEEE